jgi:hypothetical protein
MKELEQRFEADLLRRCEQARAEHLCNPDRLCQQVRTYGGVPTAQRLIRRGQVSDPFEALRQHGRLDLTLEALVVDSRYAALFTDAEVNACFMLLCECGFFQ